MSDFLEKAKARFDAETTLDLDWRLRKLEALHFWIREHEVEIANALEADLSKSGEESYMTETGLVLSEISFARKHLKCWAKRHSVRTPLFLFPAKSFTKRKPYGPLLILSPWNYPFLLSLEPLVSALAAGNTAVIKPSAKSVNVSKLLCDMAADLFPDGEVQIAIGDHALAESLLSEPFQLIFFTGSSKVGVRVLELAAKNLTPAILELGGKCPCVVDASANLELSARRLAFGKLVNAGQTCVAPDFACVDIRVAEEFQNALVNAFKTFAPDGAQTKNFPKIIDGEHLRRLENLVRGEKVLCGGKSFGEKFDPTILVEAGWDSPAMREEIFGPVLPLMVYRSESELHEKLSRLPRPLAAYVFSGDRRFVRRLQKRLHFGAMTVNDTLMQISSPYLPFGGVGTSGMGRYHGEAGFKAFSHEESFLERGTWIDIPFRYPPFSKWKSKLVHFFLK